MMTSSRLGGNVVLLWRDLLNRASQLVLCERRAPFGGYRQSGIGREGGLEGIGEFLQYKSFRRAPRG